MSEPYGACRTCGVQYDHEPALDVECPRCGAGPGVQCFDLAPSGHRKTGAFANGINGPWGHNDRDLQAVIEGAYKCDHGITPDQARKLLAAKVARREMIESGRSPAQTELAL